MIRLKPSNEDRRSARRKRLTAALLLAGITTFAGAQTQAGSGELPAAPTPTLEAIHRSAAIESYERTLPGQIHVEQPSVDALPLSLDDAIARALKNNEQIIESRQNERRVSGLRLTVANALLPSLVAQGSTSTQEINLAAMGFKPAALAPLLEQFGIAPGAFKTIVKVDVTSAQLNLNQQLFNVPAYYLYRASQRSSDVAALATLNVRGGAALAVASQYLRILADAAEITTARSLVEADVVDLQNAVDRQTAGVGVKLDTLRSRVQLQTEQQTLITAENTYSKDKIQLNRLMGLPAGEDLTLTDTVPYAELARLPLPETLALAYTKRKDLLGLESQVEVAVKTAKAVRYERLPTLAFGGYYGVLGETHGLYHGVFNAQGSLNVPIFKEAQFRGEREVADAQLLGLRQQIDSLRVTIEQQIRSDMLDVQSANDLVTVARSNVQLSREVLQDAEQRFAAGVDDNLAVVQAQSSLASAESRLVETLYQFNAAKLSLARSVGVVETQYRVYLGR